jgi:riboflavin kinase/FMN adenylyltransferase
MVVATGFFDGVHRGHRIVIDALVRAARERGTESVVVTFWPHPRNVLQNDARGLRLLSSFSEKEAMLRSLGVDRVEVIPFTREFSRLTTEEYLRTLVMERFGADAIVLGPDNRIGYNSGTTDQIAQIAQGLGLDVIRTEPFVLDGVTVSSTKIRTALGSGDVALARMMLGYAYPLSGIVVEGNRMGRTLGFPTANIQSSDPLKMVPSNGVYLTRVHTIGQDFHGMTNIGTRPTVTGVTEGEALSRKVRTVETHIFDFDEEIYGLDIRIEFLQRIRDERRFASLAELQRQLVADRETCLARI